MSIRGVWIAAPLVVAVAMGGGAAAAGAAPAARIVSPRQGSLVPAGRPLRVLISKPAGASLSLQLDKRHLKARVPRAAGGLRRLAVPTHGLEAGAHQLYLTVLGGGHRSLLSLEFIVGQSSTSVLGAVPPDRTLRGWGTELTVPVDRGATFQATLDHRRIGAGFEAAGRGRQRTSLGAEDGLHFGRNRLRLLAFHPDGSYEIERRTIVVPPTRPLAGAADRVAQGRSPVRLDGLPSLAAPGGGSLGYRWEVIDQPQGSQAKLRGANTARPRLLPDLPGRYELKLTVTQRGGSAAGRSDSSTVTVFDQVEAPPIGLPIETCAGPDCAIVLDGKRVTKGGAIQYVDVDRRTGTVKRSGSCDGPAPTCLSGINNMIVAGGGEDLWALSVAGGRMSAPQVDVFNALIAKPLGVNPLSKAPFESPRPPSVSVIGVPGWAAGNGFVNRGVSEGMPGQPVRPEGSIAGYVQRSPLAAQRQFFEFIPGDYVSFETDAAGIPGAANVVSLQGVPGTPPLTYPSPPLPAGASAGFQVLVLPSLSLGMADKLTIGNYTFSSDGPRAAAELDEMGRLLAGGAAVRGFLVFVQSIGAPKPSAATAGSWTRLASALGALGGTPTVFNELDGKGGYALVAATGTKQAFEATHDHAPAEPGYSSAGYVTGERGQLDGLLTRNGESSFTPLLADPSGEIFNAELPQIAYQPASRWPWQASPGLQAAETYIATHLSPKDTFRFPQDYTNLSIRWAGYEVPLQNLPYPDSAHGFSRQQFAAMKEELEHEFTAVDTVHELFANFQKAASDAHLVSAGGLSNLYLQLRAKIETPPPLNKKTSLNVADVLVQIVKFGSGFFPEAEVAVAAGKAASMTSAIMGAVGTAYSLDGGEGGKRGERLLAELDATQGSIAQVLATRYAATLDTANRVADIVVTDHDKLMTVAHKATFDPAWIWSASSGRVTQARLNIEAGEERLFYEQLAKGIGTTWYLNNAQFELSGGKQYLFCGPSDQSWVGDEQSIIFRNVPALKADGSQNPERVWQVGPEEELEALKKFLIPAFAPIEPLSGREPPQNLGISKPWFYVHTLGAPKDQEGLTCL